MNKFNLYPLALVAILAVDYGFGAQNKMPEPQQCIAKDGSGDEWSHRDMSKIGKFKGQEGKGNWQGRQDFGKHGRSEKSGHFGKKGGMGKCGFFKLKSQDLRPEIKAVWDKFEKLRKFKKSLREEGKSKWFGKKNKQDLGKKGGKGFGKKGEKAPKFSEEQKANFEKKHKEHAAKIDAKLKKLGLSSDVCAKLRELKHLTPEERFAINKMENELLAMQLKQQGKALKLQAADKKSEYVHDAGNQPVGEKGDEGNDGEPEPEF